MSIESHFTDELGVFFSENLKLGYDINR